MRRVTALTSMVVIISLPVQICAVSMPKYDKPLPLSLIGTWQVTKVNIDTGATRRLHVQYNDPNEKGRIVVITPDKITNDGLDKMVCTHPTVTVKRSTAAALIKESMGWRGFDPEIPTPKDFELPIANKTMVNTLWINCEKGDFGPGAKDISQNTWIVPLPNGQLAMLWYDDSILILSRLPANAKPKASFDCAKAKTTVEKTICGSVSLASFDLSVAESYKQNIVGFTEGKDPLAVKRVKASQKAWLKKRDVCGANAACLKKSMEEQLEYMANFENFYLPR